MYEKKVREAIERMRKMRDAYNATLRSLPQKTRERSDYNNYVDAFLVAIEALEKQLPKKPKKNGDLACSCGLIIQRKNRRTCLHYCHNCGQAIDWSE